MWRQASWSGMGVTMGWPTEADISLTTPHLPQGAPEADAESQNTVYTTHDA